ncbi:hypothetical protein ACE11G_12365 [Gordonia sp. PS3]|uniref:hypothetical protein n=1 Tax=Gordonia sp. PS3 TaxID=3248841 RepID=UPI0035BEBC1D
MGAGDICEDMVDGLVGVLSLSSPHAESTATRAAAPASVTTAVRRVEVEIIGVRFVDGVAGSAALADDSSPRRPSIGFDRNRQ